MGSWRTGINVPGATRYGVDAFYRVGCIKGNLNRIYLSGYHRCAQGLGAAAYAVVLWRSIREMTSKSLNYGHTTRFACVCVVREKDLGEIDPADADGAQSETGLKSPLKEKWMKVVKTAAIVLATSAMLTGTVLAQGASSDTRVRGGAQGGVTGPAGVTGGANTGAGVDSHVGGSGSHVGAGAQTGAKGTVGSGAGGAVNGATGAAGGAAGGLKR